MGEDCVGGSCFQKGAMQVGMNEESVTKGKPKEETKNKKVRYR